MFSFSPRWHFACPACPFCKPIPSIGAPRRHSPVKRGGHAICKAFAGPLLIAMKPNPAILLSCVSALLIFACNRGNDDAHAGGDSKHPKTKVLEAGAELLQSEAPLKSIHAHVCGFHHYSGDPSRQVIAHHYCSHLGNDVMQCVIYDSDKPDAKLIGIEYIISAKLFETLDPEEKKLWHSHVHEVKSGELIAPRLPEVAENELMEHLVGTYGKTWHTWQVDRGDELPLGIPQLMMASIADGQTNPKLISDRDQGYGIDSTRRKQQRADIAAPSILPGADNWQNGTAQQLDLTTFPTRKP